MGYATNALPRPSGAHTHRGGCDCGAVRYELTIDSRTNDVELTPSALTVRVREFKLLSGEECVSGHELGTPHVHHFYCELCGVCSFTRHKVEQQSAAFYAIELRYLDIPRSAWG